MHELGYTRAIIDAVLGAAEHAQTHEVRAVYLAIGELRDIVDELFVGCYTHFTKDTIAEGSVVHLQRVPLTVACHGCGAVHTANVRDDATFVCPRCGKEDYEVRTGLEFAIDRIEVV